MKRALAHPAVVLGLVALATAPALRGRFLTDDHHIIETGLLVSSWRNLPAIWRNDDMFNTDLGAYRRRALLDNYRPLAMSTYVLDHALWGKRPLGYHLTNGLLHLLAVALVLAWARRALADRAAAAAAALIVGVHPITADAWAWVSGRTDLLAAVFVLAALLACEKADPLRPPPGPTRLGPDAGRGAVGRAWAAAAGALALAACLSKETAVIGVAALAVRPRWPSDADGAPAFRLRSAAVLVALGAAIAAYLALRANALGGMRMIAGARHAALAAAALPGLLGVGALDLALPRHSAPRFFAEDLAAMGRAGLAAIGVAIAAGLALVWRARRRAPLFAWAIGAYVACVAPGALTVVLGTDGQGRYFYLPLALLAPPCAAAAAGALRARSRAWTALCAAWGVALVALLQATMAAYYDDLANGLAAAEEFPDRSHGHARAGLDLCRRGDPRGGIERLHRAVAIAPGNRRWPYHLAGCFERAGDPARALALYEQGERRWPADLVYREAARRLRAGARREGAPAPQRDPADGR